MKILCLVVCVFCGCLCECMVCVCVCEVFNEMVNWLHCAVPMHFLLVLSPAKHRDT